MKVGGHMTHTRPICRPAEFTFMRLRQQLPGSRFLLPHLSLNVHPSRGSPQTQLGLFAAMVCNR